MVWINKSPKVCVVIGEVPISNINTMITRSLWLNHMNITHAMEWKKIQLEKSSLLLVWNLIVIGNHKNHSILLILMNNFYNWLEKVSNFGCQSYKNIIFGPPIGENRRLLLQILIYNNFYLKIILPKSFLFARSLIILPTNAFIISSQILEMLLESFI